MRAMATLFTGLLLFVLAIGEAAAAAAKPPPGLAVVLRESARNFSLAPGQTAIVASVCAGGEVVVGGSATAASANVAQTWSSLFYDGTFSGWAVEYRNETATAQSAYAQTAALCTAGTMTRP